MWSKDELRSKPAEHNSNVQTSFKVDEATGQKSIGLKINMKEVAQAWSAAGTNPNY